MVFVVFMCQNRHFMGIYFCLSDALITEMFHLLCIVQLQQTISVTMWVPHVSFSRCFRSDLQELGNKGKAVNMIGKRAKLPAPQVMETSNKSHYIRSFYHLKPLFISINSICRFFPVIKFFHTLKYTL